jgi:hypothetical protein
MNYELPQLAGDGIVEYELIDFPFVPTLLTRATVRDPDLDRVVRWLEHELPRREPVARSLLSQLGAPPVVNVDPRTGLLELGRWLQGWFPLVAEPYVERSYPSEPDWERRWLCNWSNDRLGNVVAWWPHQNGYSKVGDTLLHSLVVDLNAVVMELVRAYGPTPRWSVEAVEHQLLLVARPSVPAFAPLTQIRELLLQSVGPVRGERSRSLRMRQSEILADCFEQAVTGDVPIGIGVMFPENRYRLMSRFNLKRPRRSAPPADARVLECVNALRRIGFYQAWKHSDEDLTRALEAAWLDATGRRLPLDDVWVPLILMDSERTWFEDVDVQIQGVSDQMYKEVLFSLAKIGGPGFGSFGDPEEDWRSSPDTVQLTVRWRRKKREFSLPKTRDGIIPPSLFTELNAQLPVEGPRLHYLDIGPTTAVVIRLTEDESRQLREAAGLYILSEPPKWWNAAAHLGLASVPAGRTDPLLMGTPVDGVFEVREEGGLTIDSDEFRGVSVTDMDVDGEIIFHVFVSAAEFIRGGDVENALENRVTSAIRSVAGVAKTLRTDREVWEVTGDPAEGELEIAVRAAVESVLSDFEDAISAMFA